MVLFSLLDGNRPRSRRRGEYHNRWSSHLSLQPKPKFEQDLSCSKSTVTQVTMLKVCLQERPISTTYPNCQRSRPQFRECLEMMLRGHCLFLLMSSLLLTGRERKAPKCWRNCQNSRQRRSHLLDVFQAVTVIYSQQNHFFPRLLLVPLCSLFRQKHSERANCACKLHFQ